MSKHHKADPYTPAQGTYEEGVALLGVSSPVNFGTYPVTEVRAAAFCALIEDGNASYWDEAASTRLWGRPIAPPAMLQSLNLPPPWVPGREIEIDIMVMNLPLPGSTLINVSTDIEYHRPIYVGETLNYWDAATEISEQKETRLGIGHFVTTVGHFQNERGEEIATATNIQFRFTPKDSL